MKKVFGQILFALCVAALGIFFLMQHPLTTFDKVVGIVFVVIALAGAFQTQLHDSVVSVSNDAPLLTRAIGGLMRFGRRETDTVAIVPPAVDPTTEKPE